MKRRQLVPHLLEAIGEDVVELQTLGTGWPSLITVKTGKGVEAVAFHAAQASPHSRLKDGVNVAKASEWRFQNPADKSPVQAAAGQLPVVVGADTAKDGQTILIVVDGTRRVGRIVRSPVLYDKRICEEAAVLGWSEQITGNGERIYALRPPLFPMLVEILAAQVVVPMSQIVAIAKASGLTEDDTVAARARLRRTVSVLVRSEAFGNHVKEAYGHRCAMCELDLGLVAGAHILPVQAPGSPDEVWNGMALCHNHHSAFDAHNLWVGSDYAIRIKPDFIRRASVNPSSKRFLDQTRSSLLLPEMIAKQPRRSMLERRYEYYADDYSWAPPIC